MARKRAGKIQPSAMSMVFRTTPAEAGQIINYIDLSQCASILNRRFYRQGILWAVSQIKILGTADANITISKLPNSWVLSNSWEKGFRTWQKMNNQALEEAESVKPKFLDFKIYADANHHQLGFAANLLPRDSDTNIAVTGEWESSKFVIPTGSGGGATSREIVATGASYPGASPVTGFDAVSLIEGYAASRALPNVIDPNVPQDASDVIGTTPENWMSALFDQGTQQDDKVLDDMITENNLAPYPFENDGVNFDTMYPGGANQLPALEVHDLENITSTTIGGITRIKGGTFPCGLIKIKMEGVSQPGAAYGIQVDLVPGGHRGYLCEPMTEM